MKFTKMMPAYTKTVIATWAGRWVIRCSTNNEQRIRKRRSMALHPTRILLRNKVIKTSFTSLIRD